MVDACAHGKVIVASPIGFLKYYNIFDHSLSSISLIRGEKLSSMCWCDDLQNKVFVGTSKGHIYTQDLLSGSFTEFISSSIIDDGVIKLQINDGLLFCAKASGKLIWYNKHQQTKLEINAPGSICSASLMFGQVAVGGKECNLRIWDIENPASPIFIAKNVRPTTLELPVPIWISDINFVPRCNGKLVVTASRYGELDVYDLRCGQRRPVARNAWRMSRKHGKLQVGSGKHSAVLPDLNTTRPITKVLAYDDGPGFGIRVVAGNAVGELCFLDLRLPREYLKVLPAEETNTVPSKSQGVRAPDAPYDVRSLAGASGCITGMICGGADHGNVPLSSANAQVNKESVLVVSSLDRFLRVYKRDSGERISKMYVKVPISTFLANDSTSFIDIQQPNILKSNQSDSGNISDKTDEQTEFDALWSQIEEIDENDHCVGDSGSKKRKLKHKKKSHT